MVLAVNWPPQAPAPGQAWSSTSLNSASEIFPALKAPSASYTSWMVKLRPLNMPVSPTQRPARIDPL